MYESMYDAPMAASSDDTAQDDRNPTRADVGAGTYADLGPAHGVYAVARPTAPGDDVAQDDRNPTYAVDAGAHAYLGPAHGVYAVAKAQGVGIGEATTG